MSNPVPLKAIMPFCASDHRFIDDAHWVGGALGWVNLQWGTFFKGVQASPPDPAIVGPRWRAMWQARLEAAGNVVARWTVHQRDDSYWRNGDVAVDYGSIRIPVYAVGGWVDAYTDSIPRLLEGLTSHRQALIGPWAHSYPEFGSPGPGLDWGPEELRWWYQWLCGEDTGITREPRLRLFMPEATAAEVYPHEIPGRWLAAKTWPPAARATRTWWFAVDGLKSRPSAATVVAVPSNRLVGLDHPEWLPFYLDVDLPAEQSADDTNSLTFDSEPLGEDLELLGRPVVRLALVSDQPVAQVAVRLNEVLADGRSWALTYGVLNLCHRNGSEHPTALMPGEQYNVELPLHFHAHRLRRGSRLRVAVSGSLWPLVWGPPTKAGLQLHLERCRLILQLNAGGASVSAPGIAAVAATNPVNSGIQIKRTDPDSEGGVEIRKTWPRTAFNVKAGPPSDPLSSVGTDRFEGWTLAQLFASPVDPNSGSWHLEFEERFHRGTDWDCRIEVAVTLRSDPRTFYVTESIRAYAGDTLVHDTTQETPVHRVLV
jgi:predicted acyl esterase